MIHIFNQHHTFVKSCATVVLITFGSTILAPTVEALENISSPKQSTSSNIRYAPKNQTLLQKIERELIEISNKPALQTSKYFFGLITDTPEESGLVDSLISAMENMDIEQQQQFVQTEQLIQDNQLADSIVQRYQQHIHDYENRRDKIHHMLLQVKNADTAQQALDYIQTLQPVSRVFDGEKLQALANQSFANNPQNLPALTINNFPVKTLPAVLRKTQQQKVSIEVDYSRLANANNPIYLNSSDEIIQSPTIEALAQTLNHDALTIYHWVRNNIHWIPSWGASQDSDVTLATRQGNAMDIASLTLSLLRASGIPSRYVHGTIEIPSQQAMNWIGGFSDPISAANYAQSNGIPTATVVNGNRIKAIQLEHIWVEVALDFYPSRGTRNQQADSWVSIDPSFKQYDFQTGLDVEAITTIDSEKLIKDFVNSGTLNEQEGYVKNLNTQLLIEGTNDLQQQLSDYIDTQFSDPTVGDVIGSKTPIVEAYPVFATSLPYRVLVHGISYAKLPVSLQQRIEIQFSYDRTSGIPVSETTSLSWASVNNHAVNLSFKPATPADEAALVSLIPEEIIAPEQLSTYIPANLIQVLPEIYKDGKTDGPR